jgi:hypothetical protein
MFKIIDNAIDEELFTAMTTSLNINNECSKIPFYFIPNTARKDVNSYNPQNYSWYHVLFEDDTVWSDSYTACYNAFVNCLHKNNQVLDRLLRMRVGFITALPETFVHAAHVDYVYPHNTALIYLHETDGDTILYDNFHDPFLHHANPSMSTLDYYNTFVKDNLKVASSVSPKSNRVVLFDGLQYHSSSTPHKYTHRVVININYTLKEMK